MSDTLPIKRVPVDSSALHSVGHSAGVLEVQFHASGCPKIKDKALACQCSGGSIHRCPASPEEHAAFMAADSPGAHFQKHFRNRTPKEEQ